MPDYSCGKIYALICLETGDTYIGSTTLSLKERLRSHQWHNTSFRKTGKHWKASLPIIERGCYEMVEIEQYPCSSEKELQERETYYINNIPCQNISKRVNYTEREWGSFKNMCECGASYTNRHKAKHQKSKKHKDHMTSFSFRK